MAEVGETSVELRQTYALQRGAYQPEARHHTPSTTTTRRRVAGTRDARCLYKLAQSHWLETSVQEALGQPRHLASSATFPCWGKRGEHAIGDWPWWGGVLHPFVRLFDTRISLTTCPSSPSTLDTLLL